MGITAIFCESIQVLHWFHLQAIRVWVRNLLSVIVFVVKNFNHMIFNL